jgi:hypothetical protein
MLLKVVKSTKLNKIYLQYITVHKTWCRRSEVWNVFLIYSFDMCTAAIKSVLRNNTPKNLGIIMQQYQKSHATFTYTFLLHMQCRKNKMKCIKKSTRRQKDAVLAVLCKSTSLTINNLKSNLESAKRSDRTGTAQLLSWLDSAVCSPQQFLQGCTVLGAQKCAPLTHINL